jgi:acetone carboxylase, alpha subunit
VVREAAEGRYVPDMAATEKARAAIRERRRAQAKPVSQWMAEEAGRVRAGEFATEVTRMYVEAMRLSPKFTKEFRSFWKLPVDFALSEQE